MWLPEVGGVLAEGSQRCKLPVIRYVSTRDVMYKMRNIMSTALLFVRAVNRVNPKSAHHKGEFSI